MRLCALVKRFFCRIILGDGKLSNGKEGHVKAITKVGVKLAESENQSLRIALAINNESAQEMLYRAVLQYIKDTKLPDTLLLK